MSEGRTRRLAAVWFADIVGYTALSTRNEDAALAVVDEFQRLSKESVGDRGRVVKFLGDGALAVFDSTNRALESAIVLRDAFAESAVARQHGCTLSVGVHVGEVVQADDGDVYGDGVNVAARIEGVATTNQVVVSEDVYRQIRNRPEYNPQSIGSHMLKGVDGPAPLYVLARPGETIVPPQVAAVAAAAAAPAGPAPSSPSHRKAVAIGTTAGVTGFVLLSVFVAWSVNVVEEPAADPVPAATQSAPIAEAPVTATPAVEPASEPPTEATPSAADPVAPAPTAPVAATSAATGGTTAGSDAPATASSPSPAPAPQPATSAAPAVAPEQANRLLVMVFGEAPAGTAETQILRSLGSVSGVTAIDAPSAAILRRNPDAVRDAMQGDFSALAELARSAGIEYLVLGEFESTATPLRAGMYGGSAQLGLRMYRVSTGDIIDSGTFTSGMGSEPATPGRSELGVRTQAAQDVGRTGAVAARGWLLGALRNR